MHCDVHSELFLEIPEAGLEASASQSGRPDQNWLPQISRIVQNLTCLVIECIPKNYMDQQLHSSPALVGLLSFFVALLLFMGSGGR